MDKGSAITHLAEKLGLTKDETMAIGDEENDRAMLEVVGNPVVMENGNPEIKKIAKYITKTMMNPALPMPSVRGYCKRK